MAPAPPPPPPPSLSIRKRYSGFIDADRRSPPVEKRRDHRRWGEGTFNDRLRRRLRHLRDDDRYLYERRCAISPWRFATRRPFANRCPTTRTREIRPRWRRRSVRGNKKVERNVPPERETCFSGTHCSRSSRLFKPVLVKTFVSDSSDGPVESLIARVDVFRSSLSQWRRMPFRG